MLERLWEAEENQQQKKPNVYELQINYEYTNVRISNSFNSTQNKLNFTLVHS